MTTLFAVILFLIFLAVSIFFPIMAAAMTLILSTMESWHLNTCIGHIHAVHLAGLALVAGSIQNHFDKRIRIERNSFMYPLLMIALVELASVPTGIHPLSAVKHTTLMILYLAMAFFIAGAAGSKSWNQFIYVLYSTVILSFLISCYTLYTKSHFAPSHVAGGFSDWNFYPVYLMSILPFIAWEMQNNRKSVLRYLYITLFFSIILFAVAAGSRTGMVIIVFSLLILFPMGILPRKYLVWLIPVIFIALYQLLRILGHYSIPISERFAQWFASPRLQDRFFTTIYCLKTFSEHPFLGIGSGQIERFFNWTAAAKMYQINATYTTIPVILAELGIWGGLAYAWLGSFFITEVNAKDSLPNNIKKCVISSLLIVCFSSLFYAIHSKVFVWCWLGAIASLIIQQEKEESS